MGLNAASLERHKRTVLLVLVALKMSWDHRLKARKKAALAAVEHNGLALEHTLGGLKGDIDGKRVCVFCDSLFLLGRSTLRLRFNLDNELLRPSVPGSCSDIEVGKIAMNPIINRRNVGDDNFFRTPLNNVFIFVTPNHELSFP